MNAASSSDSIVLDDVSKFYGDVLGVNRVDLVLDPGITGLVGPNGSGKSTLMNLIAGLLRPSHGSVRVLGLTNDQPEALFRLVGYCTQYDSFPPGMTGIQFVESFLRVHGFSLKDSKRLAERSIERVGLMEARHRKVAGYSKGMRQRIKLAQAIAHDPKVMVLDEPLNGLDPMARAEIIQLFRDLAAAGQHLLISSHILHEVDMLSDRVVLLSNGYVVAEGDIQGVRSEMREHPMQVMIRCEDAPRVAKKLFDLDHVVEAALHDDRAGLHLRTRNADRFFLDFNELVVREDIRIEAIRPADEDVQAVYQYLVVGEGAQQ